MFEFLEALGGAMRALLDSKQLPLPLRIFSFLIALLLLAILVSFVVSIGLNLISAFFGA